MCWQIKDYDYAMLMIIGSSTHLPHTLMTNCQSNVNNAVFNLLMTLLGNKICKTTWTCTLGQTIRQIRTLVVDIITAGLLHLRSVIFSWPLFVAFTNGCLRIGHRTLYRMLRGRVILMVNVIWMQRQLLLLNLLNVMQIYDPSMSLFLLVMKRNKFLVRNHPVWISQG